MRADRKVGVLGHHTGSATGAVVVGSGKEDPLEDRVHLLVRIRAKPGCVRGAAVDARPLIPPILREQRLHQRGAQTQHRGPDRDLDRLHPRTVAAVDRRRRQRRQAVDLGGELG